MVVRSNLAVPGKICRRAGRRIIQYTGKPQRTIITDMIWRIVSAGNIWNFPFPTLPDIKKATDHFPAILSAAPLSNTASSQELYELDKADGRKKRTRLGAVTAIDTYILGNHHRVTQANTQPFSYYIDGQRKSDDRFDYDYDVLGRVVRVRNASGGTEAEFSYDALSRIASGSIGGEHRGHSVSRSDSMKN